MQIKVRNFKNRDLAEVQKIMAQCFRWFRPNTIIDLYRYVYSKLTDRIKLLFLERSLISLTTHHDSQLFVAEANQKVVGFLHLRYIGDDSWEIALLGVDEHWRDCGVGAKLINAAKLFVKKRNGKAIVLSVYATNEIAKKLYRKLGFKTKEILYRMEFQVS
jgi:ribosomal protein S18 acetylase RimI-like enzyme